MIGKLIRNLDKHGEPLIGTDGKFGALPDILDTAVNDILGILGGLGGFAGQIPDFIGDNGKPHPRFPCTGGFHGRHSGP